MLLIRIFTILFILLAFCACRNNSLTPISTNNLKPEFEETHFIIKPEKGDIYYLGDKIDIKYKPFSTSDKVDIFVEKKGAVRYILGERIKNDGELTWQTSSQTIPSVQYKIRIVNSNDPDIYTLSGQFGLLRK